MNKRLIGVAEQALFASTIFIVFLLLFSTRFVVPIWLQPLGRMHPLLLHFPIVILLLAMIMEAFRFRMTSAANPAVSEFYRDFLNSLLLVGALSAGITVIMGLFLAKEDGYSGQALSWHKWTGVGIFFLATLVYWIRNKSWYTTRIAQVSAVTTILFLIGAGHYGATLTHGDNFLFEPISNQFKPAPVSLDKALVYADVIQPIFEQKCVSCHNPDKLKGQLNLASVEAMLKGGKTGKLFVAGKPDISLLLQRIHLPLDEKKHMPPSGKTQLTPQEVMLLSLWVKNNADVKKRVIDLPANDSLRFIAAGLFKPSEQTEEFDFDAADEETVKSLNNDYRTVAPLAKESPALAVNLYNKSAFTPEKLTELSPVKQQVVYLNLNKMPVKDADLKRIGEFENLQKLDLNFTDITGASLGDLSALKQLQTLSLAGTGVTYDVLQKQLSGFKSLKTLAVWNTKLTTDQIGQLQKANKHIQFIAGFDGASSEPIKLNPPQVKNSSTIFGQSLTLQLKHPVKGVEIRFTTDGSEPDSIHSPIFNGQTVLNQPTQIKAKAYKAGWFGSNMATFDFYKSSFKPDSVNLLLPLNPVHQADGAHTFFDGKLGTFNANSPAWANNWAGFRKNDMALVSEFKKPVTVNSVALRIMVEEETSIFPPSVIEIWGGDKRDQMKLLGTLKPEQPTKKIPPVLKSVECRFKSQTVSFLKIIAKPVKQIPDWHPNKGNNALLLVDEVFIN
ncbi:c-type cytochrome domain-containing protein [Spirosoma foliorum]|uniref:Chitobiase/beta-hexosaminidase C-terminal domain-containing protein n=1 Tax=Spirosoma foliorum TaxID=2710596 RepID=A0A7G5GPJ5_9BACT|nr:c-type cytochrome domain-containing protein [Spirosoma foliorum]QMW00787.1 chitobiase/beta-hexosaminidase C-terminal domain-containing protein [Spirosoma foliorum]